MEDYTLLSNKKRKTKKENNRVESIDYSAEIF